MHMFDAYSPLNPYCTAARGVRSSDIIRTDHSASHLSLEVDVVHHETFTNPEGRKLPVVRFDGWELHVSWDTEEGEVGPRYVRGRRIERGWGQVSGDMVSVVGTTRNIGWGLLDAIETARIFGGRYPS